MLELEDQILGLKDQVFGKLGFSTDMKLDGNELKSFREFISDQWLRVIKKFHPELENEAKRYGIHNYHKFSERLDHGKIWPKCNRLLPQTAIKEIKQFPFMKRLKKEFGSFSISDIYDTKQHHGEEEVYWRLVRPNTPTDIGPLHCDSWFHTALNDGRGMFGTDEKTVKIWVPIFTEPKKSGLMIVPSSHLQEWRYHIVTKDGIPRPVLDEDTSLIDAQLIPTEPGNMLIFNENILHGGFINIGNYTRVSAEITMVLKK